MDFRFNYAIYYTLRTWFQKLTWQRPNGHRNYVFCLIGIRWQKNAGNACKLTQGTAPHNRKLRARVFSYPHYSALMPEPHHCWCNAVQIPWCIASTWVVQQVGGMMASWRFSITKQSSFSHITSLLDSCMRPAHISWHIINCGLSEICLMCVV
jgi:hypothetical protein